MPTTLSAASVTYHRDVANGLILRWSTAEDTENIAQLCSMVFRDKADEPANEFLLNWIWRLMRGDHPMMGPGDFGIVEDTRKEGKPIVACTCLWRQKLASPHLRGQRGCGLSAIGLLAGCVRASHTG